MRCAHRRPRTCSRGPSPPGEGWSCGSRQHRRESLEEFQMARAHLSPDPGVRGGLERTPGDSTVSIDHLSTSVSDQVVSLFHHHAQVRLAGDRVVHPEHPWAAESLDEGVVEGDVRSWTSSSVVAVHEPTCWRIGGADTASTIDTIRSAPRIRPSCLVRAGPWSRSGRHHGPTMSAGCQTGEID